MPLTYLGLFAYLIYWVLRYNVFAKKPRIPENALAMYLIHFKGVTIPDLETVSSLKGKARVYHKTRDGYLVASLINGSQIKQELKDALDYTDQELIVTSSFRNLTSH